MENPTTPDPIPSPTRTPEGVPKPLDTPGASRRRRRLSVLDLLILVAATAAGLAVTRTLPGFLGFREEGDVYLEILDGPMRGGQTAGSFPISRVDYRIFDRPPVARPSYWLTHVAYWSSPCLLAWSFALFGLSLRGPRSNRRHAIRGAGPIAGVAVGVALVVQALRCVLILETGGAWALLWTQGPFLWSYHWITFPRLAGLGVFSSWLALWIAGRRSRRPDGPERLGRAVGWCWIVMGISVEVRVWLFALNW